MEIAVLLETLLCRMMLTVFHCITVWCPYPFLPLPMLQSHARCGFGTGIENAVFSQHIHVVQVVILKEA